ncbi:MAG: hypothetical protein JNK04_21410 [Myxococcales bacterium]|nr:hypothetical protein [Myxococcales bacterium]
MSVALGPFSGATPIVGETEGSYRERPEPDPEEDDLVAIANYIDLVEAELAKADLSAIGVRAFVIEAAGFNPILTHAAGGIRLMVRAADVEQAKVHLTDRKRSDAHADIDDGSDGNPDVIRCPACELSYVAFEKRRITTPFSLSPLWLVFLPVPLLAMAALPFAAIFSKTRYRCHKCLHVWDAKDAGPKELTALASDDPRPVFRLRRGSPGFGVLFGLAGGFLLELAGYGGAWWLGALVGYAIGGALRKDVCSNPECRAPVAPGVTECASCHGTFAGIIGSAHDHFSESANVRRELASERKRWTERTPKKGKRLRAAGDPARAAVSRPDPAGARARRR